MHYPPCNAPKFGDGHAPYAYSTAETAVQLVCQTYQEASGLYFRYPTHTVSIDEMPGVQAIERIATKIPMLAGQPERIKYEYKRHGTLCLIGNWHVVTGQMISPTIGTTRTENDFVRMFTIWS